ncbi:Mechanosensitive ion channel-domain-containing protein [Rhypophila decipiens]|uniref:Mechanosensitive ion channel protein n=1 Tax=Rhypophila decipiens TaxID=261697 RepID=A0AAN7BFD2_9PEZI|nr:Mechanosensitive ion channel-domain-containing protein [Rhypophila decipiens]
MSSHAGPPMSQPPHLQPERPHLQNPSLQVQVPSAEPSPEEQYDEKWPESHHLHPEPGSLSPSGSREQANRLNDDLELLRAERIVSRQEHNDARSRRSRSRNRSEVNHTEDMFNTTAAPITQPLHSDKKSTFLTRLWVLVKKFPRVMRYVLYAIPPGILILIPVFLDLFAYNRQSKAVGGNGGIELLWFGIWLEVVWLTLWASRIVASVMPITFAGVADAFGSANHKKWKDIGRQLEFPTALFLWQLAVIVSYSPILNGHRKLPPGTDPTDKDIPNVPWVEIVFKIIIAFFVLATLNLVEKIGIQWIATSFHLRTYSHRIRDSQTQIEYLVALYTYAKTRIEAEDPVWDSTGTAGNGSESGSRTPMRAIQANARQAWSKVGDAATRMAGDFTGRRMLKAGHPRKVVMELLRSTPSSYALARVFYRTFVSNEKTTITVDDFFPAFSTQEEAEACFGVFDKDLNGDVSMEELEMVCNEIHLEKKAIAASLRDLDSVIKKLDNVFMFIIVVIVIIVFISIISNSAAAALTSTGSFILGLSWLLQATAQEFLQSIIFVFVKHPFDVGDRVTVYGNTGSAMKGDDYYVLEISLLYTEFKKMEGHVVQAPNSLLNTLFILNQRRSQGLADPVSLTMRFGTTESQIEELKARMLQFCLEHKRDYAPRILSEVLRIEEVNAITMNLIFFHKSNYQNELLRLTRRNKFCTELMRHMKDMGLEGPRIVQPGGMRDMPIYWSQVQPPPKYEYGAVPDASDGPGTTTTAGVHRQASSHYRPPRLRSDTMATVVEAGMDFQDVYNHRRPRADSSGGGMAGQGRLASMTELADERERASMASGVERQQEDNGSSRLENVSSRGSGPARTRSIWSRQRGRTNTLRQSGGVV